MDPVDIVDVVLFGLTHDADRALEDLLRSPASGDDEAVRAAAVFLRVLACRFDEALDTTVLLAAEERPSRLAKAAREMAVAVCAGEVTNDPGGARADCPFDDLTAMLEVEAAMSSGLISTAADIAGQVVAGGPITTVTSAWSALALARAWCFEGRFADADQLVERVLTADDIDDWPQMHLLASGVRIFVDGHLGRQDAVDHGLRALHRRCPEEVEHDYIRAGAHVLAAFGATAVGRLAEASALILRGGGGPYLQNLQIVDRLYGYEILVEEALARGDIEGARWWAEHGAGLPIHGHIMATATLGRIRARVSVALKDTEAGIRESADSGVLAAIVGSDLEVIRARIIEASARAAGGDRIRGIEELEEVARRADAAGAAAVKDWAERELHAHGRRLRNAPGIGWDSLSTTQQAIARLAAAGLRNREIAAALWISEKTVESHVAAVLAALGTTNRVGIGRELVGEVPPVLDSALTARQREVAVLVAQGQSNSEISVTLGISEKTVEKHVAGLFERLGVRTRAAIAARVRGAQSASESPH